MTGRYLKDAMCDGCHLFTLVNWFDLPGPADGFYCSGCWEKLALAEARCHAGIAPPTQSQDPSFDNAIRAYEEDR